MNECFVKNATTHQRLRYRDGRIGNVLYKLDNYRVAVLTPCYSRFVVDIWMLEFCLEVLEKIEHPPKF